MGRRSRVAKCRDARSRPPGSYVAEPSGSFDDLVQAAAVHEAGHVVAAVVLRIAVLSPSSTFIGMKEGRERGAIPKWCWTGHLRLLGKPSRRWQRRQLLCHRLCHDRYEEMRGVLRPLLPAVGRVANYLITHENKRVLGKTLEGLIAARDEKGGA